MINDVLQHPDFIFSYTRDDLALPFAVREDGTMATIADAIRALAPQAAREEFSLSPSETGSARIKPIERHAEEDLARLAIEVLVRERLGTAPSVVGRGGLTSDQLIDGVRRGTEAGRRHVAEARQHALLVEAAIKGGRIKPVKAHPPVEPIPFRS
ncbi:MAG: hypothetical protein QY323_01615 [Patescibacteria group bacterium]|nr:MAG: hypothetical protein QY323_01615 [Patescibacteria group bacterium]